MSGEKVFLFHTDRVLRELVTMLMLERGLDVIAAAEEDEALNKVSMQEYQYYFLEFWRDSENAVYNIIKVAQRRWGDHPRIILLQQSPIPHRLFGIVEEYQVLNLPFNLEALDRVLN